MERSIDDYLNILEKKGYLDVRSEKIIRNIYEVADKFLSGKEDFNYFSLEFLGSYREFIKEKSNVEYLVEVIDCINEIFEEIIEKHPDLEEDLDKLFDIDNNEEKENNFSSTETALKKDLENRIRNAVTLLNYDKKLDENVFYDNFDYLQSLKNELD